MNHYDIVSVDSKGSEYVEQIESDIDLLSFLKKGACIASDNCFPTRVIQTIEKTSPRG